MIATPKQTPSWLLALGKEAPPAEIELKGDVYRLEHVYKHDFFAFTGRYGNDTDHVVLKIGRKARLFIVPLAWVGRLHAWHESAALRAVDDLDIVPRFRGRVGTHGFTHAYVHGHMLSSGESVPDGFFDELRRGLGEIHRRKLAYVDLEKPENVLVGDDGKPYLFDFQIAYRFPFRRGGELFPFRWLRARFQQSDLYHASKLQRRTRPDQMTSEEIARSRVRPRALWIYGKLTRPITRLRRRLLKHFDPTKKRGERGRVPQPSALE